MTRQKETAAVTVGCIAISVGLFAFTWKTMNPDSWWDGKFTAGLLGGGALLAFYPRVGKALRAIKDYIPVSWKGGR